MIQFVLKSRFLSGALAVFLLASGAQASTVALTYHGATSGGEKKTVRIDDAPVAYPGTGNWPRSVGAWGFNMHDSSGTLGDFVAWCLDLGSFLSTSSTSAKPYSVVSEPFSNSYGLDSSERIRVQTVFDANYAGLDLSAGDQAAGFQLALWNALYDDDSDVSTGAFRATAQSGVVSLANGFLGEAAGFDGDRQYRLAFLESDDSNGAKYQNLVTVAPVPLPAAGGLLLVALGGIGLAARRAKSS